MLTDIALRSKRSWGYDDAFMRRIMPDMVVTPGMIETGHTLVAENEDGPCGYALIRMENAHDACLHDLFIAPDRLRSGVGRVLLQQAIGWAREQGARRITLVSDPNATGFYERCGFALHGEVRSAQVPGRSLPRMVLDLL